MNGRILREQMRVNRRIKEGNLKLK
jgi:hypothetical protein